MQPNFTLTGDQALLQVLPATERIQEQVLRAFGATLGIGLPQSFSQSTTSRTFGATSTTATAASGGETTTGSTTAATNTSAAETTQPGVAPTVPTGNPAGGQLPAGPSVAGEIGLDPVLKYQAALALLESVQMMNRQVQNAAVLRCHVPFLVRIRLGIMPYRPNLGYALHSRVAFFPNEGESGSGTTPLVTRTSSRSSTVRPDGCNDASHLPYVVPILAADDIERAMKSRATEAAQQIGVALSAMVQGVGANLGFNNLNQTLNSIAGQDFNSRLMVTRQSDNTLYVRIGPTNQATAGAALVAQNYDIALLFLAPRAYFEDGRTQPHALVDRQIRVISHTQFRDARDGAVLPDRPSSTLVTQIDRVMRQILVGPARAHLLANWNGLDALAKEAVARQLAGPIQASQFVEFNDLLSVGFANIEASRFSLADLAGTDSAKTLWVATSSVLADTSLKSAFFQLRRPADIAIPPQTALLLDDGKARSQVLLRGVRGTSSTTLAAHLNLATKAPTGQTFSFPAQAINLDPAARVLTLTFLSPAQWGINDIDLGSAATNLVVSDGGCTTETLCPSFSAPQNFRLASLKAPSDATPTFSLTQHATHIVLSRGSGTVTVTLSKLSDDSAAVTLAGANVSSATDESGGRLALKNNGVSIAKGKDTTIIFGLTNLHTGAIVSVTAEGRLGAASTGKKTLSFTVVTGG